MRKESKKGVEALLGELGFESESRQTWMLWRLPPKLLSNPQKPPEKPVSKSNSSKVGSPWLTKDCEFAARKGSISVHNLQLKLDKEALLKNFQNLTKKYFGARTSGDFVFMRDGSFWCLFEFSRATRRDAVQSQEPAGGITTAGGGVGGFKVRILADGLEGQVIVSDIFGFGFIPFVFVTVPLRFLAESLGLRTWGEISRKDSAPTTVFELKFPLLAPTLVTLAETGAAPASLRLIETSCSEAKGLYSPSVRCGDDGIYVSLATEETEAPIGQVDVTYVPIEALEARERLEECRAVDKLMISGKLNQALELAIERGRSEVDPLYLWRRMAMLGIVGCGENAEVLPVGRALELEPDQKLFHSYAVQRALTTGSNTLVLDHLSRIGGQIMKEVRSADNLSVFDAVLPELLGDAWTSENIDRAADCYHRILEKRGEVPRVLQKLIALARQSGAIDNEISLLHRLGKAERRRLELARINLRLAELRRAQKISGDEAINLAQKALKLDRSLVPAALLTADILVERERFEEAIQALDSLLKDRHLNLSPAARHDLEATIGRIWNHHLHRPDLAANRYEMAIKYDIADLDSLSELEQIYRRNASHAALARILEAQFSVFEQAVNSERLKSLFDDLVSLYRGPVRSPQKALDIYLRLLAASATATQDLELLFSWNDIDIDWADLSSRLLTKLPAVQSGKRRAEFLCRLAEIFRDRLGDTVGAIRHLKAANQEGWIDPGGFRFLVDYFGSQRDYRSLVQAYELRIQQLSPAEQQNLIIEMLAIPAELSDMQRDTLALRVYAFDSNSEAVVKKRFLSYQQANQVDAIARLLRSILDIRKLTSVQRQQWMREALQSLVDLSDDRRFSLMAQIFEQMLPLVDDQTFVLNEAIATLKESPEPRQMLFFVRELLRRGLTPELAERDIIKLLRGMDQELAVYHELMSFKATTVPVAVSHARTAAALYSKRLGQETATEKMVARVCTLVASTPDELTDLRTLVEKTGHWKLLAKALQKQAEFEDDRHNKFKLLDQLGHVFWHKIKDHARARLAFSASARFTDEPHKIHHILAKVAADVGDVDLEKQHLGEYLSDVASTTDIELLTKNAERLIRIGEEPSTVQKFLQKHVDKAFTKGRWHQAKALAGVLIDVGIVTSDLYKVQLKSAIIEKNVDQIVECWWRGLACVANKSKMKSYLSETTVMIERGDLRHLLLDCYKAALDHNVGDRIGPTSKQELMLVYAGMLFDNDSLRHRALAIYSEAYAADPNDYRTWLPLYFLLLEMGTATERLSHLREILPKLKIDQRPLKSFPLTIESLQLELRNLEKEVLTPGGSQTRNITRQSDKPIEAPKVEALQPRGSMPSELDIAPEVLDLGFQNQEVAALGAEPMPVAAGDFVASASQSSQGSRKKEQSLRPVDLPAPPTLDFIMPHESSGSENSGPDQAGGENLFKIDLEPANMTPISDDDVAEDSANPASLLSLQTVNFDDADDADDADADADDADADDQEQQEEVGLDSGESLGFVPVGGSDEIAAPQQNMSDAPQVPSTNYSLEDLSQQNADLVVEIATPEVDQEGVFKLNIGDQGKISPPPIPVNLNLNEASITASLTTDMSRIGEPTNKGTSTQFAELSETSAIEGVEGTQSAIADGYTVGIDQSDDAADWRASVIKGDFNADLTSRLLQQAFASELEKHLAIQCVALVAGNCERLSNWHWRVWRKADEYGYPLSGKERFPSRLRTPGLNTSLHKLILASAVILVRAHNERFAIDYLKQKLKVDDSTLEQRRKQLDWSKGRFVEVGLSLYTERLKLNKCTVYDLPGLGGELFFEGSRRALYIDMKHYSKMPPSHLFHRVITLMWSVQINYFIPLTLDPKRDVMPILVALHEFLSKQGLSRLKLQIAGAGGIGKYLKDVDMRAIRSLHEKTGMPNEDLVVQLWDSMRTHIYRMQLAETLDVIGFFEALLDKDLLTANSHKHSEIYQRSAYARSLIEFVTKLKV